MLCLQYLHFHEEKLTYFKERGNCPIVLIFFINNAIGRFINRKETVKHLMNYRKMLVDINSNIADLKILDKKLAISITLKIITVFNMNGFKMCKKTNL